MANHDQMKTNVARRFEADTLKFVAESDPAAGREHIMCVIDGVANAMIRLDGSVAAAEAFYRVADRIVAGERRTVTPGTVPLPTARVLIKEIEDLGPVVPVNVLRANSAGAAIAVLVALIVALAVTPWL